MLTLLDKKVYYDQFRLLSALQFGLVSLGIVILLAGVWIVSIKTDAPQVEVEAEVVDSLPDDEAYQETSTEEALMDERPTPSDLKRRIVEFSRALLSSDDGLRGLSIGIAASSPGECALRS
jgi:hypothetical protein